MKIRKPTKYFKDWCIENREYQLLEMYENAINEIRSDEIGFSSKNRVNFKCKNCKMIWSKSLNKATTKTALKGCPYCMHLKPSLYYNLKIISPKIAEEWDYEKNLKKPEEYLPSSQQEVYWKCKNGHMWSARIKDRVTNYKRRVNKQKPSCPYCSKERVSPIYNIVTEFPNIARELNYVKNGSLNPFKLSPQSKQKVWWKCEFNHEWEDRVYNRTALNRQCSQCAKMFKISIPAKVLYYYLKRQFFDCKMEYRILDRYTADIYIPSYEIIIEYDGWYFHDLKEREEKEKNKEMLLKENGYYLIRIKDMKEDMGEIKVEEDIIRYHLNERYINLDDMIKVVISLLEEITKNKISYDINWKRDYQKIEDTYFHFKKMRTLAVTHHKLIEEMSEKNIISPETITFSCKEKMYWICPICKKEYQARVSNRAIHNSACPYCRKK